VGALPQAFRSFESVLQRLVESGDGDALVLSGHDHSAVPPTVAEVLALMRTRGHW
jgi:hypothetical protein